LSWGERDENSSANRGRERKRGKRTGAEAMAKASKSTMAIASQIREKVEGGKSRKTFTIKREKKGIDRPKDEREKNTKGN